MDPNPDQVKSAFQTGTNRIELYTENYAKGYVGNKEKALKPFIETAAEALKTGLEINAGHDLDLENLSYFSKNLPGLSEVSIGHALICDALYLGLENAVKMYKLRLNPLD